MAAPTRQQPAARIVLGDGDVHVEVEVVAGDALATPGDVILAKYAQDVYGLDLQLVQLLQAVHSTIRSDLPLPGDSISFPTNGVVAAEYVVFVGTPPLMRFGYDSVREWARQGLWAAARTGDQPSSVVATVHGVTMGGNQLDERRSLAAQVDGFTDALLDPLVAESITSVTIVELDQDRARRLARSLLALGAPADRAAEHELREDVRWRPDQPVLSAAPGAADGDLDELGRRLIAQNLIFQLDAFDTEFPGYSFLALVDGPWGVGKSTLLRLLIEESARADGGVRRPYCVVTFDAWRQAKAGPPWLLLMNGLRTALIEQGHMGWSARLRERLRRIGTATLVALAVFALFVAALVGGWIRGVIDFDNAAARVLTAIALITGAWTASKSLGAVLALDSKRRARSFVETTPNPMEHLASHFQWLRRQCSAPLLLVIDDLDRCPQPYVVELLDNVQKLVRRDDLVSQRTAAPTLFVIVAADGRWLRSAYEVDHECFSAAITEPGRPLGALFLDKLFQVRVPVPELSPRLQQAYLRALLRLGGAAGPPDPGRVTDRVRRATSHEQVLEVLRSADPMERIGAAPAALERLRTSLGGGGSEAQHALERFGPLLEPNPRSILRFLIAFSVLRASRLAEGNPVSTDPLALWAIVTVRWPLLAEFLTREPDGVTLFCAPPERHAGMVPAELHELLQFPTDELRQVFNHTVGGPLHPDVIRQCTGMA